MSGKLIFKLPTNDEEDIYRFSKMFKLKEITVAFISSDIKMFFFNTETGECTEL